MQPCLCVVLKPAQTTVSNGFTRFRVKNCIIGSRFSLKRFKQIKPVDAQIAVGMLLIPFLCFHVEFDQGADLMEMAGGLDWHFGSPSSLETALDTGGDGFMLSKTWNQPKPNDQTNTIQPM